MAKAISKVLLLSLLAATPATASTIRLRCGTGGQLAAIGNGDNTVKFTANAKPSVEEQRDWLCGRLGRCFEQFPALAGMAKNVADVLNASGSQTTSIRKLNEVLAQCRAETMPGVGDDAPALPEEIEIRPASGLNRNKAAKYPTAALAKIVRFALLQGTDPYLALSISLLENPPTSKREKGKRGATAEQLNALANGDIGQMAELAAAGVDIDAAYDERYGLVPVDATAGYTALGCMPGGRFANQYIKKADAPFLSKYAKLNSQFLHFERSLTKAELATFSKFIAGDKSRANEPVVLRYRALQNEKKEADQEFAALRKQRLAELADEPPVVRAQLEAEFACVTDDGCKGVVRPTRDKLTFNYVLSPDFTLGKKMVSTICATEPTARVAEAPSFGKVQKNALCCAKVVGSTPPETLLKDSLGMKYLNDLVQSCVLESKHTISYCIQKYNGLGCYGCSEHEKNDCFYHLQMAEHPLYGARAGDLALDTLMTNDVINQIVSAEQKSMGIAPMSLFCMREAAGERSLDSKQFYALQRSILAGREACNKYFK